MITAKEFEKIEGKWNGKIYHKNVVYKNNKKYEIKDPKNLIEKEIEIKNYNDVITKVFPFVKKEIFELKRIGMKFDPENDDDVTFVIASSHKYWFYSLNVTKEQKIAFLKKLKKVIYEWAKEA